MSSLADKYRALQQIGSIAGPPQTQPETETVASDDFGLKPMPAGYMLREKQVALATFPELEDVLQLQADDFVCIGKHPALQEMKPERTAFIDTETTGLAGGTGTYAFMIGLALVRDTYVHIKQYFMADPSQEPAMLLAVRDELRQVNGLVSFNGKAYDVPLLQSRMILNRIEWLSSEYTHLDMVHACRRLWRPFAADGRLQSMEATVLNLHRENDIPGELIPALYFDSVRQHNAAGLKPVFQHNVLDLLSLIRLLVCAARAFRMETSATPFYRLGMARTLEQLGRFEQACQVCVPQESMAEDDRRQLLLRRARNLKRLQRFQEAEQVWKTLLAETTHFPTEPYLELIKLYEHRLQDLPAALQMAQRALQHIAIVEELRDRSDLTDLQQDIQRRQTRIAGKIKRTIGKGASE